MSKTGKPRDARKRRPLAQDIRERLQRVYSSTGEATVLEVMGTRAETLWRALAGLPVQSGTRALVERALDKLARETSSTKGAA